MTGTYSITTAEWFIGHDGKAYNAVWGNVEILSDDILGIKTNRGSTNWYIKIGSEDKYMIVAGCQVNYAVKCKKPVIDEVNDFSLIDGEIKRYTKPSTIYIPEDMID